MNAPTPQPQSGRAPRESFQAIAITLSAALLVLLGIVIGRFIVTAQAVEVVDHFDADLTTLNAQLVELNGRLITAESQAKLAGQSAEHYRQLAAQQQIRADKMAVRQLVIDRTIGHLHQDHQACLDELQQYAQLNQAIPAGEVLRFAQDMFCAYNRALQQLAGNSDTPAAQVPALPQLRFHQTVAAEPGSASEDVAPSARQTTVVSETTPSQPLLSAPTVTTSHVSAPSRPKERSVFFEPPQPRRQPNRYTFFAARRDEQTVTIRRASGITFHDTAAADKDTVRR